MATCLWTSTLSEVSLIKWSKNWTFDFRINKQYQQKYDSYIHLQIYLLTTKQWIETVPDNSMAIKKQLTQIIKQLDASAIQY